MNSSAVAMASDSAASIPYERGVKTYTRARKLLPLHDSEPVAMMVWDSPEHLGLPWEVIVSQFRENTPNAKDELNGYVQAFFSFVDEKTVRWASPTYETSHVQSLVDPEIENLKTLWLEYLNTEDIPAEDGEFKTVASDFVKKYAAVRGRQLEGIPPWSDLGPKIIKSEFSEKIQTRCSDNATRLWNDLDGAAKDLLIDLGLKRLATIVPGEIGSSGIVFAGYGREEPFAQAQVWRVSGRILNRTRRTRLTELAISHERPALVVPLAQSGVMLSFIEGLHPEVRQLVYELIDNLAVPLGGEGLRDQVVSEFTQQIDRRSEEVARAIEFLPPEDLAMVAGDLISMTALRNRATMSPDTVGGPIDVVVLSRSDGFQWSQRAGDPRAADRGAI